VSAPPNKTGALLHAPKTIRLLRLYLLSVGAQPANAMRRCVACGCRVDNANLGGHARKSALAGQVWCEKCAV